MKVQLISFLVLFLLCGLVSVYAQSSSVVAGGDVSESDVNVSYSVGLVVYTSFQSPEFYLSQGIQHPTLRMKEVVDTTSILGTPSFRVSVFPNPVVETLNLQLEEESRQLNGSFVLHTLWGEKIQGGPISSRQLSIPLSNYPEGIYLLQVYQGKELVKTYKIIKD